jgi:chromosome segregation ATPase
LTSIADDGIVVPFTGGAATYIAARRSHWESLEGVMTDVGERLDQFGARLESVEGRLESVEGRLESVEGRLESVEERLESVDDRLESVEHQVGGLREDVDKLTGRVDTLTGTVDTLTGTVDTLSGKVDTLSEDVHRLQVLGEENSRQIGLIAEVQGHHGSVLEQLGKDVAPLKDLRDLVLRVVHVHEQRITALEQRGA